MKIRLQLLGVLVFTVFVFLSATLPAQAPAATTEQQPVVESYYKIAPGKTDEWLELYRAQHLPILKERQKAGEILDIIIYRPFLHQGGPEWDFKIILRYRDFAALGDRSSFDAIERRLYTDWPAHQQAERHRWEITQRHWDDIMLVVPHE